MNVKIKITEQVFSEQYKNLMQIHILVESIAIGDMPTTEKQNLDTALRAVIREHSTYTPDVYLPEKGMVKVWYDFEDKSKVILVLQDVVPFSVEHYSYLQEELRRTMTEFLNDNEIICYCSNISKGEIVRAVKHGAKTIDDIREITKACTIGNCKVLSPKKKC